MEQRLTASAGQFAPEPTPEASAALREAKRTGFSDRHLADLLGLPERRVRALVKALGLTTVYKMVDTCAAEFEAATPYFYSCFSDTETEAV